jgi:uncharacterized membrane protein HdeD (DUF308 family)
VRSLATFIGVLFIVQGMAEALTSGIDARVRRANVVTGLLSIAAGILIIVWPGPGLVAVAIVLGAWLIVTGTITISGAFAARRVLPAWWLLLILGLLEIPLGVLALANPGATLAALITVAGIWAAAIGVMRVVLSSRSSGCRTTSTRRGPRRATSRRHGRARRSDRRSPRRARRLASGTHRRDRRGTRANRGAPGARLGRRRKARLRAGLPARLAPGAP